MAGTSAPAHAGPTLKLGSGLGPCGTLVNAIVGHLHDLHRQDAETLLHCRPRRRHHANGGDCCLIKVVEVAPIFHRQPGGDAGVVIGIPVKENHLCRLPDQVIIGPTQLHRLPDQVIIDSTQLRHLSLRGVQLLLDA